MYHKFASGKLPGGLDLRMTVILPALVILPDMSVVLRMAFCYL